MTKNADKKSSCLLSCPSDRDRSYVLNEALTAYVEPYRWQMEHIKEGLRQADAGEFAPDEDIDRALKGHFTMTLVQA